MKKIEKQHVTDALNSTYLEGITMTADEILSAISKPHNERTDEEKDVFYKVHKYRAFELENVKSIIPKNTETHTIVTQQGSVCVIRKPLGRVLGAVMGKMIPGSSGKEANYYDAGSIIFNECTVWMDKVINTNEDEKFTVIMACLNVVEMMESSIKKN